MAKTGNVDGTINIINEKAPITGQYHYSKLGKNHVVHSLKQNYRRTTIHLVSKVKVMILGDFLLKIPRLNLKILA